jgi:hypothetical protein
VSGTRLSPKFQRPQSSIRPMSALGHKQTPTIRIGVFYPLGKKLSLFNRCISAKESKGTSLQQERLMERSRYRN